MQDAWSANRLIKQSRQIWNALLKKVLLKQKDTSSMRRKKERACSMAVLSFVPRLICTIAPERMLRQQKADFHTMLAHAAVCFPKVALPCLAKGFFHSIR